MKLFNVPCSRFCLMSVILILRFTTVACAQSGPANSDAVARAALAALGVAALPGGASSTLSVDSANGENVDFFPLELAVVLTQVSTGSCILKAIWFIKTIPQSTYYQLLIRLSSMFVGQVSQLRSGLGEIMNLQRVFSCGHQHLPQSGMFLEKLFWTDCCHLHSMRRRESNLRMGFS